MYLISILISKTTFFLINLLKIGSGYTWPGHIALKLFPTVLKSIKEQLPDHVIFVSGTNGKTTTSKLINHILTKQGKRVLHNDTGANLLNGFVSTILLNSSWFGKLNYDALVIEVDEATLPALLKEIEPSVLALLNLSRDQLDRHWEIDIILDKWVEAIESSSDQLTLILDGTQSKFEPMQKELAGEKILFDDSRALLEHTNLVGSFNAKNVNCAVLVSQEVGISKEDAVRSLKDFDYAYGRGERIIYKGKSFRIFLAKNPESLNQNLSLLQELDDDYDSILYVLNDNVPDGHDVSWIFDIKPELLEKASSKKQIFVSGTRAYDMAVRLGYAKVKVFQKRITPDLKEVFGTIASDPDAHKIVVLPNYSAMLESRKILVGRKIL